MPDDEWGKNQFKWFRVELILEDLHYRKVISVRKENKIRKQIAPWVYKHLLSDPCLDGNPKLRKMQEELLVNDWIRKCLGKGIEVKFK